MANTYYSTRTQSYQKPKVVNGMGGAMLDTCTLLLAEYSANDVFYLFWIPRGAKVVAWGVAVSASIDSNVSPTSTVQVGTFDSAARFLTSTNFGQGAASSLGMWSSNAVNGVLPYAAGTSQAASLLDANGNTPSPFFVNAFTIKANNASATYASGATIRAWVLMTIDDGTDTQ